MWKALVLAFSILVTGQIASAEAPAERLVAETVERFENSQSDQIAETVLGALNVEAIARFTLGRHAGRLEEGEKDRFTEAMSDFIRRQIDQQAEQLSAVDVEIIRTVERNARDAIVTTRVHGTDDPLTLRWRVIERGGTWSVVDLEFAGIWLAIEQRAQVDAILARPGAKIEDVIERFG